MKLFIVLTNPESSPKVAAVYDNLSEAETLQKVLVNNGVTATQIVESEVKVSRTPRAPKA